MGGGWGFGQRVLYSSRCTKALQAAASSSQRSRAVSCAPSPRGGGRAPEALFWRRKLLDIAANCLQQRAVLLCGCC
eukprot:3498792-Alexandrium_andersonii.AAC.1